MTRDQLFAPIEPYETGVLPLDSRHRMYWEQSGTPGGIPALFLHGGPGAGATAVHRRFFDPTAYRIVVFDQRGSGRSEPRGAIEDNTTQHLIDDIERLRDHLNVDKWLLFGGSWGSSLALAYAEAHPERCLGLILRGIFLCRRDEVTWFLEGMRRVFPEAWNAFAGFLPERERTNLLDNYYRRLTDPDPEVHLPAGAAWSRYESACSTLLPNPEASAPVGDLIKALGLARIEAHYFVNDCFLEEGALLTHAPRLKDIPGVIVQGRYDMVCPIVSAAALHAAWPGASYLVIPDAGHSAMEPGIRTALVQATERFKTRCGQ